MRIFLLKTLLVFFLPLVAGAYDHPEDFHPELYKDAQRADAGYTLYSIEEIVSGSADLIFLPFVAEVEYFDFTDHYHWVKFDLRNESENFVTYYLETARPCTDKVDLFRIHSGVVVEHLKSGDAIPFSEQSIESNTTLFELKMSPRENAQFYMHLKSDGQLLLLPLVLYTPEQLIHSAAKRHLANGVFYGMLLVTAMVFLLFYTSMREKLLLYFSFYLLSLVLLQFGLDGYLHQFIFTDGGWMYNHLLPVLGCSTTFLLGLYADHFLKLRSKFKMVSRIFDFIYVGLGILAIGSLLNPTIFSLSYLLANILSLLLIVTISWCMLNLFFHGKHVDLFFSLGILAFVVGIASFILSNLGVIPVNTWSSSSLKIGGTVQVIFLSVSMRNFVRQMRKQKILDEVTARKYAEEASDLKLYLMSNVSHELRTPLNTILNVSSDLENSLTEFPEHKQKLSLIGQSGESLLNSINNLLNYYKLEKEGLVLELNPVNLNALVERVRQKWSHVCLDKGLTFNFEGLIEKESSYFWADEDRLLEILNNLIDNAVKFTSQGVIEMKCSGARSGDLFDLTISISDTGVGIPSDRLSDIYSSFTQECVDDKRAFGGLGLGLSIAKRLVELMDGQIDISSKVGEGTQCLLKIPMQVVAKSELPVAEVEVNQPELAPTKILVVEDNIINQMVLEMTISNWNNVSCETADNGSIALEKLKEGGYDMIFMDLQMPVMDGYEATDRIRSGDLGEELKNIPIIAVTADITEKSRKKVFDLGMNDYQSKPITGHALYNKVYKIQQEKAIKPSSSFA